MDDIESKWMLANGTSQCSQVDDGGSLITLYSLRGLFIVTGIVSSLALVASFLRYLLLRGPRVVRRRSSVRISDQGEQWASDEDHPEDVELPQRQPPTTTESREGDGGSARRTELQGETQETSSTSQGREG